MIEKNNLSLSRYEEYAWQSKEFPFLLSSHIRRTKTHCSREANWHESPEIELCCGGEGWVLIDGEKYPFQKGDVVVINPDSLHYTATDGQLEYTCIIVDPAFLNALSIDLQTYAFLPHIRSEKVARLLQRIEEEYRGEGKARKTRTCLALAELLSVLFEEYSEKRGENEGQLENGLKRAKEAIFYIREHLDEKITLDEIAKAVYCDKYALTRIFKKATGQTVVSYINAARCVAASQLLSRGASTAETAFRCGFENVSYFIRTFRKYTGKLPSDYKKNV